MSKLAFTGDALWGPCPDGGSLHFVDGEPIRSGGLQAAVYISLFGGNELDDGAANSKLQWWGNHIGNDEPLRSRTGTLLMTLPMTLVPVTIEIAGSAFPTEGRGLDTWALVLIGLGGAALLWIIVAQATLRLSRASAGPDRLHGGAERHPGY